MQLEWSLVPWASGVVKHLANPSMNGLLFHLVVPGETDGPTRVDEGELQGE